MLAEFIKKLPVWFFTLILALVSVFVGALYVRPGMAINCGKNNSGMYTCGFNLDEKLKESPKLIQKYYGFYYTINEKGIPYCASEEIDLFISDNKEVSGIAHGKEKDGTGKITPAGWKFSGYLFGTSLALAYITESGVVEGNGVYSLWTKDGNGYFGHWMGISSATGKTVQCYYRLSTRKLNRDETCESRMALKEDQKPFCTVLH